MTLTEPVLSAIIGLALALWICKPILEVAAVFGLTVLIGGV